MEDYKKVLNIALFAIIALMAVFGFVSGTKSTDKEVTEE